MAPIRDSVGHAPNQSGLDHAGLDPQYEPSPWRPGPDGARVAAMVDAGDRKPRQQFGDPDSPSACPDADPAPERKHPSGAQPHHFLLPNGSAKGPWGAAESEGKMPLPTWGTHGNGAPNPSTSNPNANHGAWPGVQNSGHNPHVPQRNAAGAQVSWGGQAGGAEADAHGKSPNPNTEFNGPSNTTNGMSSSLPNSTGPAEVPERGWPTGAAPPTPVSNGTLDSAPYGTAWPAPPGTTHPGDKCPAPRGDTVNAFTASQGSTWSTGGGAAPSGALPAWGGASSSSSSSSSSNAGARVPGERGGTPGGGQQPNEADGRKGANGWKSLEDDALGLGGGAWGRSTGSESSGGSSGTRDARRRPDPTPAPPPDPAKLDVDPRVLSNQGWGQTPVRQNTAWDVSKPGGGSQGRAQAPPPPQQQHASQGGWGHGPGGTGANADHSNWAEKKSSGWGDAKQQGHNGWDEAAGRAAPAWGAGKDDKSSTWNNAPKSKPGWAAPSGGEGWGGDGPRGGHWGEPGRSGGWDSDSSGWGDKGNTWGGATPDPPKSNNNQGWGEPIRAGASNPTWDDPAKGPDAGSQGRARAGPSPLRAESTGWEEPSPESVRRRMEIDDGTAAWGDPGKYDYANVNMWNRNAPAPQEEVRPPGSAPPGPGPSNSAPPNKDKSSGWGEPYPAQQKVKPPPSWSDAAVDNGTSAWGKTMDNSWKDPGRDGATPGGWSSQNQHRAGSKQDGWTGEVATPSSWEEEKEPEIGMWNNNTAQEVSQPGNWSWKKVPPKVNKGAVKQDDLNMNQFVNQFTNMNFQRDSEDPMSGKKLELSTGMLDKRMDVDKHSGSMAEFGRPLRHALHKDSSPYMDKNTHMYGGGNAAAQGRNSQHPPAQALGSAQPNLRNQVPPPLLPSQVPPSLLKYPPGNGGLNPLFNPQQMAMLNQLSQINQLQRLLLQQKAQSQRLVPGSNRHAPEQQPRAAGMFPPPRHMDPPLLKQHSPPAALHQPRAQYTDAFMSSAAELHKEQHLLNSYSNFPPGLTSDLNVNHLDLGGVGFKEPQSRLKKWTAMDVDQNPSKPGAMSSLRMDDAPFSPYALIGSSNSPISPPDSVGDGWPPRAKSPHSSPNVNWPPEFRPGEPWKGYPNIDPETDPFVTPGSVINNLSINTVRDVDHLRDRTNGASSSLNTTLPSNSAWTSIRASNHSSTAQSTSARSGDSKWSPGSVSNSSLAHELWKVPLSSKGVSAPSRPPPGLTGHKPSWGAGSLRLGGWGSSEPRYTPGSSWGESSSGRTNWLVLKNLTPQIDGSTLRTLCLQHGPLITFHLSLAHGTALVCYSSRDEAGKAQKSLHMCVLGNTTILADFASEDEINRFFAQGPPLGVSSGWQNPSPSPSRLSSSDAFSSGAELPASSLWAAPAYSSSLWSSDGGNRLASPAPITSFLQADHLTGGDSM